MKYSFNTWVYGSFPTWLPSYPLEEVIRRLARFGYDGIEIGCASPHAWPAYLSPKRRQTIRSLLKEHSIVASSLLPAPGGGPGMNPASPLPEERKATVSHYKEVVDLAADLGAGLVLYIVGWQVFGTTRRDAWNWSLEGLVEIARHSAERNITIVVEPTPADSNLVETADDALEMMEGSGQPNVKVMFDTFHVLYRNEVPSDYVYRMGSHLAHLHASDSDRLPPGEGRCNFTDLIYGLKQINYQGFITMEIGFHTRQSDPDAYARKSISYLRGLESRFE